MIGSTVGLIRERLTLKDSLLAINLLLGCLYQHRSCLEVVNALTSDMCWSITAQNYSSLINYRPSLMKIMNQRLVSLLYKKYLAKALISSLQRNTILHPSMLICGAPFLVILLSLLQSTQIRSCEGYSALAMKYRLNYARYQSLIISLTIYKSLKISKWKLGYMH